MRMGGDRDVHEWSPSGPLGLSNESHSGLVREAVSLARVAGNARTHDVFPIRLPAAIARHYVVQIQHLTRENLAAILASVVVPLKNIVAREFDFLLRQALEEQKHNHPWHTNPHRHCLRHLRIRMTLRKVLPTLEVMSEKTLTALCGDHLRVTLVKQSERAAGAACIHRLPKAVENQNRCVENRLHKGVGVGYGHPSPSDGNPR